MQVFFQRAKGKKDRVVPVAKSLLPILKTYKEAYKPTVWLFENQGKMDLIQADRHIKCLKMQQTCCNFLHRSVFIAYGIALLPICWKTA
jgi:integrase